VIEILLPAGGGFMLGSGHVREGEDAMKPGFAASDIDTSKPHPARIVDEDLRGRRLQAMMSSGKLRGTSA
jgi:hypothetical protein